jgi:ACS family glucarate transporter-like MFS transporter
MTPTLTRFLVLALLCVACLIGYIDRGCIGLAEKTIAKDLKIDDRDMGHILGAFYLGYTLFQIPSGWLGQLWGSRFCLTVCCVAWSAATLGSGLSVGFLTLFAARFLMGVAEAGIVPCCNQSLSRWFSPMSRGWTTGMLAAAMGGGSIIGSILTGELLGVMTWPAVFMLYAVPGLLWAAWFGWWFRDDPARHRSVNRAELELIERGRSRDSGDAPAATPWGQIVQKPAMWWISAQQFCRAASQVFYSTWLARYMLNEYGVEPKNAGVLVSLPSVGLLAGSLMGGFLSDALLARTGSAILARKVLAIGCLIAGGAVMLIAGLMPAVWGFGALMLLGCWIAGLGGPCAYAATIDLGGRYVAPVFSIMNMAGNLAAYVFPVVVPWLLDATADNWYSVLALSAGLNIVAAVCWLFFDPREVITR